MTILAKTICIKCKHHNGASPNATWYDHFCLCPFLERQEEQDPVTGKIGYSGKNDLGGVYIEERKYSHCRVHNRGNCTFFETK